MSYSKKPDSVAGFDSLSGDIQLKKEQRDATKDLALNKGLLAVLPTGMMFR